ncbi:MAG: phosphatase PAP2 family protein [Eubacterium sp.]|nr:phosphatase PAP2 family protein [Eubacterium sp.]MBR0412202.1 phosphatase PAP2 family protein [Eubacterium sp.]
MNPILLAAVTLGDKINDAFYGFDMWAFHFFGSIQNGFFTVLAKFFTTFGDEAFVIPMVIVGVVLCFFKKTRKYGFALIFAIVIGTLVTNIVVKPMALRIRPYNTLQDNADYWAWYLGAGQLSESDYSFPSGHTTAAFEIAVSMALVLRSEGKKKLSCILPVIAVCTLGSRVYLMVHYASDVLCGLVVGTIAGVCGYFISVLICKIFEKVKFLDAIDVDKLFKKFDEKQKPKYIINKCAICLAVAALFCVAFIPSLTEGGEDAIRCSYNEEYDCQNEARHEDEKYPAIDGKEYCKMHWKEKNAEVNGDQAEE